MKKYYLIAGLLLLFFLLEKSSPTSNTAGISTENKFQPTIKVVEISPTQVRSKAVVNMPTAEPTVTLQLTTTLQPTITLILTSSPIPTIIIPTQIPPTQYIPPTTSQINSGLSNDKYYTNVDGEKIHSPAYSDTIPQGATAKCKDGTYSFSQHRRGTCSGHGGVAEWL